MKENDEVFDNYRSAFEHEQAGNKEDAFKLYTKAAETNFISAQINLANLYSEEGSLEGNKKAEYWYKRAYRLGSADAANNLSIHYHNIGKKRRAAFWQHKAKR